MEPERGELGYVLQQLRWLVASRSECGFNTFEQARYDTLVKRERELLRPTVTLG